MIAMDEVEGLQPDLEQLLVEVFDAVLGEEPYVVFEESLGEGPAVRAVLAIQDETDGSYVSVEVRMTRVLASMMAARMFLVSVPGDEDVLDAMGELGNIVGGNVKSLIQHSCRLSLPDAAPLERAPAPVEEPGVVAQVSVLGQIVELVVSDGADPSRLFWPGDVVETRR